MKRVVTTTPLFNEEDLENFRKAFVATGLASERANYFVGELSRRTVESRLDKLLDILHNQFQIVKVTYATQEAPIDRDFLRRAIDARHGLFHAKANEPEDFKKLTDKLILLAERVVVSLLVSGS